MEVMVQFPEVATALPNSVGPSNNFTVAPASAVPEMMGETTFVTLSVFERPVSLAEVKSGAETVGTAVSIVTEIAAEFGETLPAASVARAAMLCTPSASGLDVIDQDPATTVVVPMTVVPSKSSTVAPVSPVPVKVGVLMLVTRSTFELPVSLAGSKFG